MTAVLAAGDGAVLSHCSAAALWGIAPETGRGIDVSLARHGWVRRPGLRVRARAALPRRDLLICEGIPVTRPVRTLVDLGGELSPAALERAVNEADKRDLVDPETLRRELHLYAGVTGVTKLRTLLDRHTFRLSDTELEVLFRPLATGAGLPTPRTKEVVNGYEVDFHWPELGLVVETDGLRYHRTAAAQYKDARRDQTHTAAGMTPLRFSHYQVKYEPDHVRRVLRATAARLRR